MPHNGTVTLQEFSVITGMFGAPREVDPNVAYLVRGTWDDYGFGTLFHLWVSDENRTVFEIGPVKIAKKEMVSNGAYAATVFTSLSSPFQRLDDDYFSLGQSPEYYENLVSLGETDSARILKALRDIVLDPQRQESSLFEEVLSRSLLRTVSWTTVLEQYPRILAGDPTKSGFTLTHGIPTPADPESEEASFRVRPDSLPPTNVHAFIGSNGAGKTTLLAGIRSAFSTRGSGGTAASPTPNQRRVAGIVSISFSAFDAFIADEPVPDLLSSSTFRTINLGLQRSNEDHALMDNDELRARFEDLFNQCMADRRLRLEQALSFLAGDPVLGDCDLSNADGLLERINFGSLSSGHKVVLLTLVGLVASVEEKMLVLIDEPESHLHPPLLAAFTRSLSWLLTDRNGVAIIATHSPVVLQELPASCVYKVRRTRSGTSIRRPQRETFGENLGVLTYEVFQLEIEKTGYHRMLSVAAQENATFEDALASFGGELGDEAKSILRILCLDSAQLSAL